MIQFSSGGSQFYAGKGLDNTDYKAAIAGAVSGAYHVRAMAEQYGVPVVLHTDHCAKKLLPWVDGMLAASERYYKLHGEPLFSSHMLDLSEEPLEENIDICVEYMERMAKMDSTFCTREVPHSLACLQPMRRHALLPLCPPRSWPRCCPTGC